MTTDPRVRNRFSGRVSDLRETDTELLFNRTSSRDAGNTEIVKVIIGRLRSRGDVALRQLSRELDGVGSD